MVVFFISNKSEVIMVPWQLEEQHIFAIWVRYSEGPPFWNEDKWGFGWREIHTAFLNSGRSEQGLIPWLEVYVFINIINVNNKEYRTKNWA